MEEKVLTIEFSGNIKVKAKTFEEASDIFWEWVMDIQDNSLIDWFNVITQTPNFERIIAEEELMAYEKEINK